MAASFSLQLKLLERCLMLKMAFSWNFLFLPFSKVKPDCRSLMVGKQAYTQELPASKTAVGRAPVSSGQAGQPLWLGCPLWHPFWWKSLLRLVRLLSVSKSVLPRCAGHSVCLLYLLPGFAVWCKGLQTMGRRTVFAG